MNNYPLLKVPKTHIIDINNKNFSKLVYNHVKTQYSIIEYIIFVMLPSAISTTNIDDFIIESFGKNYLLNDILTTCVIQYCKNEKFFYNRVSSISKNEIVIFVY